MSWRVVTGILAAQGRASSSVRKRSLQLKSRKRRRRRPEHQRQRCRLEQLEPRQLMAVQVLQPMGTLDVWEDGHDGFVDLRPVFQSDQDQPLAYEVVENAHQGLVQASIEQWALRWRHLPDRHGSAGVTVRARGQVDGAMVLDTLTLNVVPVNDWPALVRPLPELTMSEGATAVIDLTEYFADVEQDTASLAYAAVPFEVGFPQNPIASTDIVDGLLTLRATDNGFGYAKYAVCAVDELGARSPPRSTSMWTPSMTRPRPRACPIATTVPPSSPIRLGWPSTCGISITLTPEPTGTSGM